MTEALDWILDQHGPSRLLVVAGAALLAHLLVVLVRRGTAQLASSRAARWEKFRTITSLVTSAVVFTAYFLAIGFILEELNVPLKTYLASASIVALAVGFGSQGLVQDIVTGTTLVFSNLVDVGDMVEVSGQIGVVKSIGLRFTVLENFLGAQVAIPNRTINNVVNYRRGYVRMLVDIELPKEEDKSAEAEGALQVVIDGVFDHLPGVFRYPPSIEGTFSTRSGKKLLRAKLRIWPGQGAPIEKLLVNDILRFVSEIEPSLDEKRITISYEAEPKKQG